eukprot:86856_1
MGSCSSISSKNETEPSPSTLTTRNIPFEFDTSRSDGFTYLADNKQQIAQLNSSALSALYMDASTAVGDINTWWFRFEYCDFSLLCISMVTHNNTVHISKTLPDTLPSFFSITVTMNRKKEPGFDELIISTTQGAITRTLCAQKRGIQVSDFLLRIALVCSSPNCLIKASKNPIEINTSVRKTDIYDSDVLEAVVHGFIRQMESIYCGLHIPNAIKDMIRSFSVFFATKCTFDASLCGGFEFAMDSDMCTAYKVSKGLGRLWLDGYVKFGEEHWWKIVFKDCSKQLLRIQFDNHIKEETSAVGVYDTIGKNVMTRLDKVRDLPNPFTMVVVLDRKDIYRNQYFIDDADADVQGTTKTKFGGWDRLKIIFVDINYEINAERPQLIDDLQMNMSIMSSTDCIIQAWKTVTNTDVTNEYDVYLVMFVHVL